MLIVHVSVSSPKLVPSVSVAAGERLRGDRVKTADHQVRTWVGLDADLPASHFTNGFFARRPAGHARAHHRLPTIGFPLSHASVRFDPKGSDESSFHAWSCWVAAASSSIAVSNGLTLVFQRSCCYLDNIFIRNGIRVGGPELRREPQRSTNFFNPGLQPLVLIGTAILSVISKEGKV